MSESMQQTCSNAHRGRNHMKDLAPATEDTVTPPGVMHLEDGLGNPTVDSTGANWPEVHVMHAY